ncbi:HAD domain-containing protein [Streptomyces sp. NPDC088194]|uniref:HAD domain-containing protein n=1 Tax=Streptomyces sp. NPDC088194 TaxID=3154931 RepID=UPI00344C715C
MHQIPYLLLDIDGVLVPFPAQDKTTPATHTRHQVRMTGRPDPVTVWLNHHHGPMITDAIATGLIRPVWCTSWRADAPGVIGPLLGLPVFEYIDLPRLPITTSHPDGYLWKRDHVDACLGIAPAAWIDDDFTALDHEWAADRTAAGHATLLIQPEHHVGLQPEHVFTALEWAADITAATEAA